jgi:hypothetical protein
MHDLHQSIIRILNFRGQTLGAGFVIYDHLAVTCAHIVQAVGSSAGQTVHIQFFATDCQQTALVLSAGWSPQNADDLAFLQLDHLPQGIVPVVLGSAEKCSEHSYLSFGFAKSAGYDNRWASGTLHGIVYIPDRHKQAMLQLKGDEIQGGMSGAPILDTQTDRVVGMVSEYGYDYDPDNGYSRRLAWATTSDTLHRLASTVLSNHSKLHLWPVAYGPVELQTYLQYLISSNEKLFLPDGRDVLLERIYVSLRADQMNAAERQAEHELYLEDVEVLKKWAHNAGEDRYAKFDAIHRAIIRQPRMLLLQARDRSRIFGEREHRLLSLAEVEKRHRYVVVLGDPGSGKTTLGKWLVLQFARALLEGQTFVQVRADLVQPGARSGNPIDLGPTRLPFLIRIADYARERWEREGVDNHLSLENFISRHWNSNNLPVSLPHEVVHALVRDYLIQGRALVVLDGLDEVSNPNQRRAVMQTVKNFIQAQPPAPKNNIWAGNRLLLTSRIVGYQFDPLTDLPHYTVENMDDIAIGAFCRAWMEHVAGIEKAEEQGEKLKDAIFDHSHPGVRTLAGNPLLLTILAQVYSANRSLPTRRVGLYDAAVEALYNQRKDRWESANISLFRLTQALGAVAAHIHAFERTGFAEGGTIRAQLWEILSDWDQVEMVLQAARQVSGFLVERGEGVYGFVHRAVQEYFAARHLTNNPSLVSTRLAERLLEPTWREPIALAVGIVSQQRYPHSLQHLAETFDTLLHTPDPAGDFLPRRELLAVAACIECERLPPQIGLHIAQRLLTLYAHREGGRRSPILRKRIHEAFRTLRQNETGMQAEFALCDGLLSSDFELRYAAIDVIIETEWDSIAIVQALVKAWSQYADPAISFLAALDEMFKRSPECFLEEFLPLRQILTIDPILWEKASINLQWKAIFRLLYLPFGAYFKPDNINRDSPLTPYLIDLLRMQNPFHPSVFTELCCRLVPLASQPGSALARDAALVLSVLGNEDWIFECIKNADNQGRQIYPIIACLVLALSLFELTNQSSEQALANDLDLAIKLADNFIRSWNEFSANTQFLQETRTRIQTVESLASEEIVQINVYLTDLINDPALVGTYTYELAAVLQKDLELAHEQIYLNTKKRPINELYRILDDMNNLKNMIDNENKGTNKRKSAKKKEEKNQRIHDLELELRSQCVHANKLASDLGFFLPLDIVQTRLLSTSFIHQAQEKNQFVQTFNREDADEDIPEPVELNVQVADELLATLDTMFDLNQQHYHELVRSRTVTEYVQKAQSLGQAKVLENQLTLANERAHTLAAILGPGLIALDISRSLEYTKKLERRFSHNHDQAWSRVADLEIEYARTLTRIWSQRSDFELALSMEFPGRRLTGKLNLHRGLSHAQELIQLRNQVRESANKIYYLHDLTQKEAADFSRVLNLAKESASQLLRQFARALTSDAELSREIDLTGVRRLDLNPDLDFAFGLVRPMATVNELLRSIGQWQYDGITDAKVRQHLESALSSAKSVQKSLATSTPIARVMDMLITTYTNRWPRGARSSDPLPEAVQLHSDTITNLVDDLSSPNDGRRERAKACLVTKHYASRLGQEVIEQLAKLIHHHVLKPQITTQLSWTLEAIVHDQPSWLTAWIGQMAGASYEKEIPTILESVCYVTAKTCETILDALPSPVSQVNKVLLSSLSWQVRLKQIPRGGLPMLREKLFAWLVHEEDPDTRSKIFEVLGHWQESTDVVGLKLLDQLNQGITKSDLPALYKALAQLAAQRSNIAEKVQQKLRDVSFDVDAAAALIRLNLVRSKGATGPQKQRVLDTIFHTLPKMSYDRSHCIKALIKAGVDDDIWDTEYHDVLVNATCAQFELQADISADQSLLADLLAQFEVVLLSQNWPLRRFILAVVAACMEVMPGAVQHVYKGNLEVLLIKATTDAESFNSRRFALTALSYLRTVTTAILPALLVSCYDTEKVQQETIAAVKHFQSVEGDLLPVLMEQISSESVIRAYMVAHLLNSLGGSAASETSDMGNQIIEAIVEALKNESSQRDVFISGELKGKLEDVLYTTLLRVAGWMG